MNDLSRYPASSNTSLAGPSRGSSDSLADVLERVLDKGLVVAGDIKINLLDIELLTIKIRLLIASADKAREMGIDWWAHDPQLSSKAKGQQDRLDADKENQKLKQRIEQLESRLNELTGRALPGAGAGGRMKGEARGGSADR
jgi:hypothetical protein